MKTTKLLSIILLFILTQSCNKDADQRNNGQGINTYHYLTSAQINQTPYFTNPAFDTISFTRDKGDTLTFVKTKTDTTWYYEKPSSTSEDKDYYQTIHNTYASIKGIGSFDVKHIKENKYLNTFVQLKCNDKIFYYDDVSIDDVTFPTYIGDILKNGKNFRNTLYLYHNDKDSLSAVGYVNKDFGLFYIEDKTNNLKYLINK